jgi:hypothetical protein
LRLARKLTQSQLEEVVSKRNELPRELAFALRPFFALFHVVLMFTAGLLFLIGVVQPSMWAFRHPEQIGGAVTEFLIMIVLALGVIAVDGLVQKIVSRLPL